MRHFLFQPGKLANRGIILQEENMELSHVDQKGEARMVDISNKRILHREAMASGKIYLNKATLDRIGKHLLQKGDVLAVARIAGINAAKKTSELIPLCHQIPVNTVNISFALKDDRIDINAHVVCDYKTGIEMEALTSVSVAALTIYDMCKAVDKTMVISDIKLEKKVKNEI
jgi:cyclic pyranopterin phosphate synthase